MIFEGRVLTNRDYTRTTIYHIHSVQSSMFSNNDNVCGVHSRQLNQTVTWTHTMYERVYLLPYSHCVGIIGRCAFPLYKGFKVNRCPFNVLCCRKVYICKKQMTYLFIIGTSKTLTIYAVLYLYCILHIHISPCLKGAYNPRSLNHIDTY